MTIREVINALEEAARRSPLGDETVVHLCELDRDYLPIVDVGLDMDPQAGGGVALVAIEEPLSPQSSTK